MKAMQARFDTRLSKEQKDFFEKAAALGGFRSLTEFVIHTLQAKARQIMEEHDQILATKRDQELFFDALLSPTQPNKALEKAAEKYKRAIE